MSEYFTSEQMRDLLTDTKDAVEALEEKVEKIISGETPAAVQLTGSIPEYNWFTTDGRPTPKEPTKPAIGVEVDADTMEITGLLWNGQEWEAR